MTETFTVEFEVQADTETLTVEKNGTDASWVFDVTAETGDRIGGGTFDFTRWLEFDTDEFTQEEEEQIAGIFHKLIDNGHFAN